MHNSYRLKFLCSLFADASYKTLLDRILALPVSVSSCFLFIHINLSVVNGTSSHTYPGLAEGYVGLGVRVRLLRPSLNPYL
jgi:hypothetical protein